MNPSLKDIELQIAGIELESYVDGPGIRTTVFVQGCSIGCQECQNPTTHDPASGSTIDLESLLQQILGVTHSDGITIGGGEPFQQPAPVAFLCEELKKQGKHIVVFSGYTYEKLKKMAKTKPDIERILAAADVLIDGPFVLALRDLSLAYRGSANQRIIDLRESAKAGMPLVLDWDQDPVALYLEQTKQAK